MAIDIYYEFGKDTGRFWDAGAADVHWVIAGEDQVEDRFDNWRASLAIDLNFSCRFSPGRISRFSSIRFASDRESSAPPSRSLRLCGKRSNRVSGRLFAGWKPALRQQDAGAPR